MEEIMTKCNQLFAVFGVLCTMLLVVIFVAVAVIAQNIQKQGTKNEEPSEQPIRMALCINGPCFRNGTKNWFTVGKVYAVNSGHIIDDQKYEWEFAHKIKNKPHVNTCGGGYEFYVV